jgi:hypothetical protein
MTSFDLLGIRHTDSSTKFIRALQLVMRVAVTQLTDYDPCNYVSLYGTIKSMYKCSLHLSILIPCNVSVISPYNNHPPTLEQRIYLCLDIVHL